MEASKNEAIETITAPTLKEYLNPKEVSEKFGFSVSTLAKFRMENKHLNFYKMGKYIKYKRAEIIEFIESHKIAKVA